ncbi:hypothetical protein K525DRAFT_361084 [Schizophyllum commune Loenen D]|nr:hypothetical protein K525DRAFT_361084 [Schizophyllum commune Loenen D]
MAVPESPQSAVSAAIPFSPRKRGRPTAKGAGVILQFVYDGKEVLWPTPATFPNSTLRPDSRHTRARGRVGQRTERSTSQRRHHVASRARIADLTICGEHHFFSQRRSSGSEPGLERRILPSTVPRDSDNTMDACNSSSSASCTVRFASHCAFIPAPCKKSKGASTPSRSDSPAPSVSGASPLSPTKTKARVTTKAVSIPLHKLSLKLPLPLVEFGPLSPPNTPTSTPAGFGSPRSEYPAQRNGSPAPPPVPPKPATPTKSCLRAPRLQPVKKRPTTPRRASMPLPFAPMQLVQEVKPVPGRTLGEIEVVPVECTLAPLARRRKPRLAGILRLAPRELEESPEEAELRALRAHELKGCCAQCASACTASALQAEQWTLGARRAWAAYTFGEHMAPAAPAPAGHLFSVDEVDLLRRRSQEPIVREGEASATAIVVTDEEGGQIATEPHSRQVSGESSLSSSSGSLSSHSTDSLASIGSATLTSPPTSPPCSPPQCLSPPLSFSSSPLPSPLSSSSAISSPALSTDGFPLSGSPRVPSSPCVPPKAPYRPSVADDEDELFPLPARKCSPKLPCPRSPVKARRASAICAMDRVVDMSTWKDKEGEKHSNDEKSLTCEKPRPTDSIAENWEEVTMPGEASPTSEAEQIIAPSLARKTVDRRRSASLALSLPTAVKPLHRRSSSTSASPVAATPVGPVAAAPSSVACATSSPVQECAALATPPPTPTCPPTSPRPKAKRRGSILSTRLWKGALTMGGTI